jgi:hypothetical protein
LYIDGVREAVNVLNPVAIDTANDAGGEAANDVRIGAMYRAGSEMCFKGLIDDVRIYDRPLTEAEIAELAK